MDLNEIKDKIRHYLDSSRQTPLLVDVADAMGMMLLEQEFNTDSFEFVDASKYCTYDSLPQIDKLQYDLAKKQNKVFLTGLSTFLLLQGEEVLKNTLRTMLDMEIGGKLVILTFQCSPLLNYKDRRLIDSGRLLLRDDIKGKLPVIYFVASNLADNVEATINGIGRLSLQVERCVDNVLYVKTEKCKRDFHLSLFSIKQYSSAYDMIVKKYVELQLLESSYGTEEQWSYLLKTLDGYESWQQYVDQEFGGKAFLGQNINKMQSFPANQRWSYFLAMKIHGVKSHPYLFQALALSESIEELYEHVYSLLFSTDVRNKTFESLYDERKKLLESLDIPIYIVSDFCKQAESKGREGLSYLTDCTKQEKESMVKLIAVYADSYDTKTLYSLLKKVCPQLSNYLANYDYSNEFLTRYFNAYKFNKLTNQILPEFRQMMEEQAIKREYNVLLQPRSLALSKIDINNSRAYFIDALGVEYLSYIRESCYERNMECDISIARCNLPSITSQNKEFEVAFKNDGIQLVNVKKLDELKHEETSLYNYEHTKLPIHLLAELSILDEVIENIESDLNQDGIEKIVIVSDHGASRLAVINNHENKWAVSQKGQHSGRCCPISDINEKPDFATEENEFWCLANYDRFKGGRRAQVEVHGGASLEEVTVPIITIRKSGDKPKCEILPEFKSITVSFKKKASVMIFIAKQVNNAKVIINGNTYEAKPTEQNYLYQVDMPDLKRGTYFMDVYIGENKIAQDLTFEAKSAGASENKYF